MKCERFLSDLRQRKEVVKSASRGERVMGSLFPNRGTGWP
jgi:hypothetical protein